MIQSPEGNRAIGCLPKSITTSISCPISWCLYNSLLIPEGNSSRNSSSSVPASDRDVEAKFGKLQTDPFPEKYRSDGLRISGDWTEEAEDPDEVILLVARRVRRKDEETLGIKLEFWRKPSVEIGIWFTECHELWRSMSKKCEFRALISSVKTQTLRCLFLFLNGFFLYFLPNFGVDLCLVEKARKVYEWRRESSEVVEGEEEEDMKMKKKKKIRRIYVGIGGKWGPQQRNC